MAQVDHSAAARKAWATIRARQGANPEFLAALAAKKADKAEAIRLRKEARIAARLEKERQKERSRIFRLDASVRRARGRVNHWLEFESL